MMLRTSSNSINPTFNMTWFTIRKNLGLLLLSVAAVLMLCPGFYIVRLDDYPNYGTDLVWVLASFLTVGACLLTVFYNVINFLFLYSKKSSDVFHALPLTRMQLMTSRCLAGVISSLVPVIVGYVSLAIVLVFLPNHNIETSMIFSCMAYTVMTVLVCSAFSMLFIVCAGSAFDLVLSFFGFNGGLLVVGLVIMSMMNSLLVGASNAVNYKMFEWLSPFWYCGAAFVRFINNGGVFYSDSLHFFVRTVIYIAVFFILSLILFDRRKAEKGGDAYAYRFIYILTSFVVGIAVSYFVGYIFRYDNYDIVFWLFAALGALMFAVAFGAVTDRGFKYFKRSLIVGACSVTALLLSAAIFITGAFGYSTRVPEKANVKSVTVEYSNEDIVYTDPTVPISVHKAFVEDIKVFEETKNSEYRYVNFNYILKSGITVSREYSVPVTVFNKELFALYSSNERLLTIEKDLKDANPVSIEIDVMIDSETKKYTFGTDNDNFEYISSFVTQSEFEELLKLYRADLKKADSSLIEDESQRLGFYWNDTREEYKYNGHYYNLLLDSSFEGTINYIDSLELYERQADKETTE